LRIVGARIYNNETSNYRIISRQEGYDIKESQLPGFICSFFYNGIEFHGKMILHFLSQLKIIREWIDTQHYYRFYSSSILFVYDGVYSKNNSKPHRMEIRMIDFAHVIKSHDGKKDLGYLTGLENLIKWFEFFSTFSSEEYRRYIMDIFPDIDSNGILPEYKPTPKSKNIFSKIKKTPRTKKPADLHHNSPHVSLNASTGSVLKGTNVDHHSSKRSKPKLQKSPRAKLLRLKNQAPDSPQFQHHKIDNSTDSDKESTPNHNYLLLDDSPDHPIRCRERTGRYKLVRPLVVDPIPTINPHNES